MLSGDRATDVSPGDQGAFQRILELVHRKTGTDFGCYRPATVTRRVLNRMISVRSDSFEHYLGLLTENDGEARQLAERITIKVSRFYRNALSFDLLRQNVLADLAARVVDRPLRIWSAGCAYGEEAYTLAMLLEEAGLPGQIEASDIDLGALQTAAAGIYRRAAFDELPEGLFSRFVGRAGDGYQVDAGLRKRVRFSVHDLTSTAALPWSAADFDLILCRNVLIYFSPEVKERALLLVRSALRPDGYLCLGEAEWPLPCIAPTVTTLAHKARIFRALPEPGYPNA